MSTTAKTAIPITDMSHHRSAPPVKPPTTHAAQFARPSEIDLEATQLFASSREPCPVSMLQSLIDEAPSRLAEGAHPTTRMAVGALDWHSRELEIQLKACTDPQLSRALTAAIDALDAAGAVLKCLQPPRSG